MEQILATRADQDILERIASLNHHHRDLRTVKKQIGEEKLKNIINQIYPKYTLPQIEKITGIADSTLGFWLKNLNIKTERWHIETKSVPGDKYKEEVKQINGKWINQVTINITPELAYIIGFTLGDGAVQKYSVEVFNKDEGIKKGIETYLESFQHTGEDKTSSGIWRIRLHEKRIANLIKENKKTRYDTIDYILSKPELANQFIAAFWDAEGSVQYKEKHGFHIYLYNTNLKLLEKIENYLNSITIICSKLKIDGRNRQYTYNGRAIIAKKILYRLYVPKSCRYIWAKEIGTKMLHSKKSKIIKQILEKGEN